MMRAAQLTCELGRATGKGGVGSLKFQSAINSKIIPLSTQDTQPERTSPFCTDS